MSEVAKVFVEKDEDVVAVAGRVAAEFETEITLVIPKGAATGTLQALRRLKREAGAAGKTIVVESVDAGILSRSKAARIEATHPLLRTREAARSFSDIVPAKTEPRTAYEEPPESEVRDEEGDATEEKPRRTPRHRSSKMVFVLAAAVLLGGGAFWLMSTVFARAKVVITFKKTPWHYEGTMLATKTAVKAGAAGGITLPAQVFRETKNVTQLFPASGRARVSEKATAKITIYNAYSSEPQVLVATTRFLTPDGKLFRLDSQTLVPGAQIKDGKIIPAAVSATVTADAPGDGWNVGPTPKLTIPGFKGTPKYSGFYGELNSGASGGFVGEKATPTEKDIAAAKDRAAAVLRSTLGGATTNIPSEFKVLEGASEMRVTRLSVNKGTNAEGNFSVFGEAELRVVGFRESDVRTALILAAGTNRAEDAFRDLRLTYGSVQPNFDRGDLSFKVVADGTLASAFDPDAFKAKVTARSVKEAQASISALPGLAEAKVTLWPFWLWRLPAAASRVDIVTP